MHRSRANLRLEDLWSDALVRTHIESSVLRRLDRVDSILHTPRDSPWFWPREITILRSVSSDGNTQHVSLFDRVVWISIYSLRSWTNRPVWDDHWFPEVSHRTDRSSDRPTTVCRIGAECRGRYRIRSNDSRLELKGVGRYDRSTERDDVMASTLRAIERSRRSYRALSGDRKSSTCEGLRRRKRLPINCVNLSVNSLSSTWNWLIHWIAVINCWSSIFPNWRDVELSCSRRSWLTKRSRCDSIWCRLWSNVALVWRVSSFDMADNWHNRCKVRWKSVETTDWSRTSSRAWIVVALLISDACSTEDIGCTRSWLWIDEPFSLVLVHLLDLLSSNWYWCSLTCESIRRWDSGTTAELWKWFIRRGLGGSTSASWVLPENKRLRSTFRWIDDEVRGG